ncbi:hypothetical protein [uncultured Thiodictyon sp.]|jgi:hypothetical protein|uniref:hypothetical protein n=1 Tax=uncultured Thiodictyon sp. TaxID=1846217 RepID=UPI0025CD6B65|nr:hypothetical protein [uncultured Thiodictyon sp.]
MSTKPEPILPEGMINGAWPDTDKTSSGSFQSVPAARKIVRYGSLMLLLAVLILIFTTTRFRLVDDAYISFRYAYNLAHGEGLVFNVGERVEGITNLLWTLIVAAQIAMFEVSVRPFVLALSLGLITFACLRLWQLAPLLGASPLIGTLAAILLLLNPEFIYTTTNGLEAALYTALLVEVVYRYCRGRFEAACLFAALLFMTRPEGAPLGLLLIALEYRHRRSVNQIAMGSAIWVGIVVLVTLFRIRYYGSPVPNSVLAKSLDLHQLIPLQDMAFAYVKGFAWTNLPLIVIFAWALWQLVQTRSLAGLPERVLLFCVTAMVYSSIIVLHNAGDWMPGHRLFLQYGTLYAVAFIPLAGKDRGATLLGLALLLLTSRQTVDVLMTQRSHPILAYAQPSGFWFNTSQRLAPILQQSDMIGAEALGYVSYSLIRNRFHDPIGLTDAYIARHGAPSPTYGKTDISYTLGSVKPAVMIWHWAGHLKGAPQALLDNYRTFCAANCASWNANVVMIRRDRLADLAPAFLDWMPVKIDTDRIGDAP